MNAQPARFLQTLPLFSSLSPSELEDFAFTGETFRLTTGEILFRQNTPAHAMYCIESGAIELSTMVGGSGEKMLGRLGPGAMFGEAALLDGGARSATARATEETQGWLLQRRAFDVLRGSYRPSAAKVLRKLAEIISARITSLNPPESRGGLATREPTDLTPFRRPSVDLNRENLMRLPPFKNFEPDELEQMLSALNQLQIPKGTVLFREGEPPGACFITVCGAVEIYVEREERRRKLAVEGPGAMFGEASLFTNHPRSATGWAREKSVLLECDLPTFERLYNSSSPAAFKFFEAAVSMLIGVMRKAAARQAWFEAELQTRTN